MSEKDIYHSHVTSPAYPSGGVYDDRGYVIVEQYYCPACKQTFSWTGTNPMPKHECSRKPQETAPKADLDLEYTHPQDSPQIRATAPQVGRITFNPGSTPIFPKGTTMVGPPVPMVYSPTPTQLLYLAGPITGLEYGEATDWRKYVMGKLPSHIIGIDPMRGKDYLKGITILKDRYDDTPLSTGKAITTRDRFDCMRANAVLVNFLGAKWVSIGTVMEVAWADSQRIPLIIVMEEDNIHRHSMLEEAAGFVVPDLDTGIQIAVAVLSPQCP